LLAVSALVCTAIPTAWAQEQVSCPPLPGTYVELVNQPYALCAGAETVNFDEVTYAKCKLMRGNSLSAGLQYPEAVNPAINVIPREGNIATVNKGSPASKGYVVSTYSPPAGAVSPRKDLALYTCNEGGSYAQCDGGICFTSTRGKTSPLWGKVGPKEIICSCPVVTTATSFQVFGPGQCPTTRATYDAVCATNATAKNNGAVLYIGSPTGGPEAFAACLSKPVIFNKCDRPAN
jgi:hypothetical protein